MNFIKIGGKHVKGDRIEYFYKIELVDKWYVIIGLYSGTPLYLKFNDKSDVDNEIQRIIDLIG